MSKTRPKPFWWSYKTINPFNKTSRRLMRKGQRRVRERQGQREIKDES